MLSRKYPRFICKNSIERIEDYDGDRCYKLSFHMNRRGKKNILVIGRAPKPCDNSQCNKMIQRILKYINSKKEDLGPILKITVVNLFVTVEYDRQDIVETFFNRGETFITGNDDTFILEDRVIKNDDIIISALLEADYIILGWGEAIPDIEKIYNARVEHILKLIRKHKHISDSSREVFYVGDLTKRGYPRHCLCWGARDELLKFEW